MSRNHGYCATIKHTVGNRCILAALHLRPSILQPTPLVVTCSWLRNCRSATTPYICCHPIMGRASAPASCCCCCCCWRLLTADAICCNQTVYQSVIAERRELYGTTQTCRQLRVNHEVVSCRSDRVGIVCRGLSVVAHFGRSRLRSVSVL